MATPKRERINGKWIVTPAEIRAETYEYGLQLFSLPHKDRLSKNKIDHERLCADLYVAYKLTGQARFWYLPDSTYEDFNQVSLIPDRQFLYDTTIIFLEVDRGGENYLTDDGIKGKIDKYIKLSRLHPDHRFHVCFTTIDDRVSAITRANGILNLIATYNRRDQFMVTLHKWAAEMPEDAIYITPDNPEGVALSGLL